MNKNIRKFNRVVAIFLLVIVVFLEVAPTAKASIFDWFTGPVNNVSSPAFSFIKTGFSLDDQLASGNQSKSEPLLIQGQSLVSSGSPATAAPSNSKNTVIKTVETIIFASAYSSTPDQTDDDPFTTAWGTQVRDGIVAANFLPFGTKIKIPEVFGDKIFVVEDRMNARYWRKIDIWFPDRSSALEFGLKKVKIQILES